MTYNLTSKYPAPRFDMNRIWCATNVHTCCIQHGLYTCGDNVHYAAMLDYVRETDPTYANLHRVATDIYDHSDPVTRPGVITIMDLLENDAVYHLFLVSEGGDSE